MKRSILLFLVVVILAFFTLLAPICNRCVSGSTKMDDSSYSNNELSTDNIRLVFVGDVMGHETQLKGAWFEGGDSCYNFTPTFEGIKKYVSSADLAIANFEVTLAGEPYSGYPSFSSPNSLAVDLQEAGFDLFLTANNHILDRGAKGLENTLLTLEKLGITNTGTFRDSLQWRSNYPLIMEKKGFRLAFLNYTYGTNMSRAKPPMIVNYIDTVRMAADLRKARTMNVDFIIACVHWGEEYKKVENKEQVQIANFLAQNGCNLIVGAHPHAIQPIKKVKGIASDSVLVAYSLGNFISNQRWRYSDGGIMLDVTLTKKNGVVSLDSYHYEPFWVRCYPEKGVLVYRMIPVMDYLTNPDRYTVPAEDEKLLIQFHNDTKGIINN